MVCVQDQGLSGADGLGPAGVDHGGGQEPEARVAGARSGST